MSHDIIHTFHKKFFCVGIPVPINACELYLNSQYTASIQKGSQIKVTKEACAKDGSEFVSGVKITKEVVAD
jgi:hypothetical protein